MYNFFFEVQYFFRIACFFYSFVGLYVLFKTFDFSTTANYGLVFRLTVLWTVRR